MTSGAYYNEHDPQKAAWLRELIKAGLVAPGTVDERSIADVQPADLVGFTQCHFFAGIGVWSYAFRLARWPDDRPAWTASTPCPSFSAAGKGLGFNDPRHLWPELFRLARVCRPRVLFGEQVAAAIGHGWLDLVCGDLEAEGYAVAPAVLGAHSAGAPHIRQRLYFCAHTAHGDRRGRECAAEAGTRPDRERRRRFPGDSPAGERADAEHRGLQAGRLDREGSQGRDRRRHNAALNQSEAAELCDSGQCADADGRNPSPEREQCSGEQRLLETDCGPGECADPMRERGQQECGSSSGDEAAHGRARWNELESNSDHISTGDEQTLGSPNPECDGGRPDLKEWEQEGRTPDGRDSAAVDGAHAERDRCEQGRASEPERKGGPAFAGDGSEPGIGSDAAERGLAVCGSAPWNGGHSPFAGEPRIGLESLGAGLEGHLGDVREWRGPGWLDPVTARSVAAAGATRGFWADCDWWYGRDGKYRPIGPGLQPLAHGSPARVVRLRGYGDAICAPTAQAFIEAAMEVIS